MCELYSVDQVSYLREVEMYCSFMFKKMCRSHNFSVTISNTDYKINQCGEQIFSTIETKNVYMHIAQRYTTIQHQRFGCSVRTFVSLLGCMLHYLITFLEEGLSRRYIIQGIQESFEILCHLYRKSSISLDLRVSFKIEKETGVYILSKINKYIMSHIQGNAEESENESYASYIKKITESLCHYGSLNMMETLWLLVKDLIMFDDNKDIISNIPLKEESNNPISNIGAMLSNTFKHENNQSKFPFHLSKFKEINKTLTYLVCTQPVIKNGKEFSIHPGILVTINDETAAIVNKFIGLRNCLLFGCNIQENDLKDKNIFPKLHSALKISAYEEGKWKSKIIDRIKEAQVNCIIASGICDKSLKNELQRNMDISVIEEVPRKALEIIGNIMDVDVHVELESTFTACQLLINVLQMTTLDKLILCSIHIPKWMEIFGVTYVNLKTVLVRHSSIDIAQAMFESFQHNLKRIENAFSLGYYLTGGGKLESTFDKELNARANDKIINNKDSEPIEQKCRVMLAVSKGLELYHFHLSSNIAENEFEEEDIRQEKLDDLESKIGCIELLSQCLTNLFSTNLVICSNMDSSVPLKI